MKERMTGGNLGHTAPSRGWVVGKQSPEFPAPINAENVEVKVGFHKAGEGRLEASVCKVPTLSILASGGPFVGACPDTGEEHVLRQPGDWLLWTADTPHTWRADGECFVVTVRWRK